MPEFTILRLQTLSADDMRPMLEESAVQGFGFVKTLVDEFESGKNRFDTQGAALFGIYETDRLIGVGGVQRDPYLNRADVGRIRHVYVLGEYRRHGVGKRLLDALIQHAGEHYTLLTLRTPTTAAAAFYEAIGFSRETVIPEASHSLKLNTAPNEGFRQAWHDAMTGNTHPTSILWDDSFWDNSPDDSEK
jgi:GNAT superfamily N-acetyltransferase